MAGKRQATSDLNHDNWDREEDPEERGSFRTAPEEELKTRVIKRAKRKIVAVAGGDATDCVSGSKSVFSGFQGFGQPAAAATSSPFSFLSKIPAFAAATSAVSSRTSNATPTFSSHSAAAATTTNSAETEKPTFSLEKSTVSVPSSAVRKLPAAASETKFSEYYKKLSSLNQAACEWIKTHVDKNPVCILSPIFKDYEKYLEEIEIEKKKAEREEIAHGAVDIAEKSATGMGSFSFSIGSSGKAISADTTGASSITSEAMPKTNGFSFGLKKLEDSSVKPASITGFNFTLSPSTTTSAASSSTTTSCSSFSFGNLSNNTTLSTNPSQPFSFIPGGTSFSFGNVKPLAAVSGATTSASDPNEEEDEEPPENEFTQVVENDAVYSKKCKVFVKKDGNFVDKGVGTLYLKPVESSGKTQLLVRADTNLGNILVNLILSSAIPSQRMGKNNVMMICLPTPDIEKPTSMLLRVKTSAEADELLENIDKYKK